MSPKKSARYIAYARVSTTEQACEGVSLDAQRSKLTAWAQVHEVELVEVVSDEGVSASTTERPGLQRVLAMLRSGEADGLVVTKLDRLTRSTRDLLALVDELFRVDRAALVSIAESVDTATAAGRLVLTVLGALATWEREAVGERTSEVLRHLRSQGVRVGREGFGWRYTEDVDEHGRRVVVEVPEELRALRRIRSWRSHGHSFRRIADRLNEDGVPTKRGGRWHASTVMSVLGAEYPA